MSRRALTIISLAAIVPIGFESKFYGGPAHVWVNDSLGGAFYDMFWCLAAFFAFPARQAAGDCGRGARLYLRARIHAALAPSVSGIS